MRPDIVEEATCMQLTVSKRTDFLKNSVSHLKKCHAQENKTGHVACTAYICLYPLGQKKESYLCLSWLWLTDLLWTS